MIEVFYDSRSATSRIVELLLMGRLLAVPGAPLPQTTYYGLVARDPRAPTTSILVGTSTHVAGPPPTDDVPRLVTLEYDPLAGTLVEGPAATVAFADLFTAPWSGVWSVYVAVEAP